jgi:hypothetical protein
MKHPVRTLLAAALAVALLPAAAPAVGVSGQVTRDLGGGVPGVNLDFFDRLIGQWITVLNDTTDASGLYAVDVPASRYDILFEAPVGTPLLDTLIVNQWILDVSTFDVTLRTVFPVTGWVTDPDDGPLFNIDLDFEDVASGITLDTGGDNSDSSGFFSPLVPPGTYHVFFTPPLGVPWAAAAIESVTVADTTSLDTIRLEPGFFVSGTLIDTLGAPVTGTDLDFEVSATGDKIYTPRDNSDGLGVFNVVVGAETYDVTAKPGTGTGLAWRTLYGVPVAADTSLDAVVLYPGFAITGTVVGWDGPALAGVDLDMVDLTTGLDLPTRDDNTDASGLFSLLAAADTIDLEVKPPAGSPYAAVVLRQVEVTGPTALGTIALPGGFQVSGMVTDAVGAPVAGADIDAFELGTGLSYPIAGDDTDAAGAYAVRLPAGSWVLVADPPAGFPAASETVVVDPLSGDQVVNFVLGSELLTAPVGESVAASPALLGVAPNPFNPRTEVSFRLPHAAAVSVSVFDVTGRRVRDLVSGAFSAGRHVVAWDGLDDDGRPAATGVYLVRLRAEGRHEVSKALLLR